MAGGYSRVNAHDDDDHQGSAPTGQGRQSGNANSPPPSFHSRSSSNSSRQRQNRPVNSDLADAFDDPDGDETDDDADDRQRLVRRTDTTPATTSVFASNSSHSASSPQPSRTAPAAPVASSGRVYGGGVSRDGVFANLMAKPESGDPEKEEAPPTYEQAAADAAPPYWETTILAPGLGGMDEVFIDGLPVGSVFSFVWNGMISMSFQLVGFLLTYLLHSTHAAKNGSRAGLGITLIQYGFYMRGAEGSGAGGMEDDAPSDGYSSPPDPNAHDFDPTAVDNGGGGGISDIPSSTWIAYILMIVGWFVLIRAISDYLRARRHEQLVLQSPDRGLGVPIIAQGEQPSHVV